MFEEPSSGSKAMEYGPVGNSGGIWTGSVISSEAMMQKWPQWSNAAMKTSLANSSSFFTSSPCTFCSPVRPRISARPALLTSRETTFAPSAIWPRIPDSSPVASGCAR